MGRLQSGGIGPARDVPVCTELHILALLFLAEVIDNRLYHSGASKVAENIRRMAVASYQSELSPDFKMQILKVRPNAPSQLLPLHTVAVHCHSLATRMWQTKGQLQSSSRLVFQFQPSK